MRDSYELLAKILYPIHFAQQETNGPFSQVVSPALVNAAMRILFAVARIPKEDTAHFSTK